MDLALGARKQAHTPTKVKVHKSYVGEDQPPHVLCLDPALLRVAMVIGSVRHNE